MFSAQNTQKSLFRDKMLPTLNRNQTLSSINLILNGIKRIICKVKVYSVKRRLLISAFSMNKCLVTRNKAQVLRYVVLFRFK